MEAAASRPRGFAWRTVWLYFAIYPMASTAGLAAYVVWNELTADRKGLGVEFGLFMALIFSVATSLIPALVAGLLAAAFHRADEPPWRSALIGVGVGVLAAEFFPLLAIATLGTEAVSAGMDSPNGAQGLLLLSLCAGVLAGLCSGLAQRWRREPRAASLEVIKVLR